MSDAFEFLWRATESLHPFVRDPARILIIAMALAGSLAVLVVPVMKAVQMFRAPGTPLRFGIDTVAKRARKVAAKVRQPVARYLLHLAAAGFTGNGDDAWSQPPAHKAGLDAFLTEVENDVEFRSFLRRFCADMGLIAGHPADFVARLRRELHEGATCSSGAVVGMMRDGHMVAPVAQYLALGLQFYSDVQGASRPLLRYFLDGDHPFSREVAEQIYLDQLKKDPERKSGLTQMLAQMFP